MPMGLLASGNLRAEELFNVTKVPQKINTSAPYEGQEGLPHQLLTWLFAC